MLCVLRVLCVLCVLCHRCWPCRNHSTRPCSLLPYGTGGMGQEEEGAAAPRSFLPTPGAGLCPVHKALVCSNGELLAYFRHLLF